MDSLKEMYKSAVKESLLAVAKENNISVEDLNIFIEKPPKAELGDFAFPMFSFAKVFRLSPAIIASKVAEVINSDNSGAIATPAGPYVNIKIDPSQVADGVISRILDNVSYGDNSIYSNRKIMVEFSCPNTNKPLHLGHLRNDCLGESISRILKANGADVKKVNLINDRGIHICKSMLAYKEFGEGKTPESEGVKGDHFVGDFYVKFAQWAKSDESADVRAREMLVAWEKGDSEIYSLWELMNKWTVDGIKETYKKTGISFDTYYYESKTYDNGRNEVLKGLDAGSFYKTEDGTVWVDLEDIGLDKKVLLRGDGTTLYLTQDIGTAVARQEDWPFDQLVYVVASEQQYHFKVLFHVLEKLGYDWAKNLYHLSYGMVNLPEGKMKSREGTVVDADELFDSLSRLAREEIISKGRESEISDLDFTSDSIALAALNFYLLTVSPTKDMIFNPKESIAFNGATGPYIQYMGARINSLLSKFVDQVEGLKIKPEILSSDIERTLVAMLDEYPEFVAESGVQMDPSIIANFLYDLCKSFSRFYHDIPILVNDDRDAVFTRIMLSKAVLKVLKHGCSLLNIPILEKM
ncbi:MAG: arginine--tRNA ligase [Spirochaetales bacterium]|nr:arginine--tRNA ligase [Spirochaetales bacterium]